MSLNFNGSTTKRRINLGNRNLMTKNKSSFLKNAQQERFKREQEKKRINAAILVQSRLRSYIDLQHARIEIAENWNGNPIEFKFFFENLIKIQDNQISLNQLQIIKSHCLDYNTTELKIIAQTLISAISNFDPKSQNIILAEKILNVLLTFLNKLSLDDNLESFKFDDLLKFLVNLYYSNHKSILPFIFQYSKFNSFVLITYFFSNPYNSFIDESINQNLIDELTQSIINQFNMIPLYQEDIKNLSDAKKLGFLKNVSKLFFEIPQIDYQIFLNSHSILALSNLFGDINSTLNIVEHENETYLFADDSNYKIQISEDTYRQITEFYKPDFSKKLSLLNLNIDLLISFVYSLLQFASLLSNHQQENSNLKSSLIINLMTSSTLLKDLYFKISDNEFYQTLSSSNFTSINATDSTNPIDFTKLWEFIFDLKNIHWWHLFYVFQENYLILLIVSNDDGLFSHNRMNKRDFKSFIIFLKNFVSFVILNYRYFNKSKDNKINLLLFLKATKISIKLLKQIYLRNLRMKLYNDDFWLLKNFEFNVKIILPLLKSIENIHDDSDIGEEIFELQDYDYLESSNLIKSFNKNITKLQIDSIFILTYIPYMISFEKRAEIFHSLIQLDKESFANNWFPKKMEGTISRESVFLDSFENFGNLKGTEFKNQFSVQFINKFGETEAGIDGGGLTKELLTSLVNSSFVPSIENKEKNAGFEFFKEAVNHKLYPNPEFYFKLQFQKQNTKNENIFPIETRILYLQMLRFLGMVIGKCMYENVLINISFAPFFLNKWSQINNDSSFKKNFMGDLTEGSINRNSFDDLIGYDLQTYQSLSQILNTKDENDLKLMGLTFTTTDSFRKLNGTLQYVNVNLIPNGDKIYVDLSNKLEFSYCITKFKLDQQISIQSNYFLEGLYQVIKPHWLSLFNPYELQTLISGGDEEIDINDLEKNVEFGGYLKNDKTIEYLFELLKEFNNENKCKFLKFVTSSSRQPLLGFKELYPKFGIRNSGNDLNRLPTSSTCVNLLKLPDYKDKNLLRQKLLYSINSEAGFDLS